LLFHLRLVLGVIEASVGVAVLFFFGLVSELEYFGHDFGCEKSLAEKFLIVGGMAGLFVGGKECALDGVGDETIKFLLFLGGEVARRRLAAGTHKPSNNGL